jgi:SAM-dependent methyltransferase
VRGYDSSPHMLSVCRANCAARGLDPVLLQADMVTFADPGAFEAVVIPAGSFALVTGHDRAAAALRNIRDSLAPAGRLIVDVEPPRLSAGPAPMRHWWHGEDLLTLTGHTEVDAVTQRTTSWNRYELWRAGELIKTELEPFTLQWYGLSALTDKRKPAGSFRRQLPNADGRGQRSKLLFSSAVETVSPGRARRLDWLPAGSRIRPRRAPMAGGVPRSRRRLARRARTARRSRRARPYLIRSCQAGRGRCR